MKNNSFVITPKLLKIIFFSLLLFFYGFITTYKIPLPATEDLPRQMKNGEMILQGDFRPLTENLYSYTQTDHYFANHHWLYGVFTYLLHQAVGWNGMVVFKVLFILLTFIVLFRAALLKADFWLVALCSIPAIFVLAGRADLRPEMFGYFFVALYVYLLLKLEQQPKTNTIFWIIPAQILWANLHITFPIGPMLVGGFLLEKLITSPPIAIGQKFSRAGLKALSQNHLVRKLALLLVILAAVSFLNPLGIKGVIYSLTANIGSGANGPLVSAEVQPLSSTIDSIPKGAGLPLALIKPMMILLGISFLIGYKRRQWFYFLGSIATATMAFYVIRSGPFLAIFFLLAFSANLNRLFLAVKQWVNKQLSYRKLDFELCFGLLFVVAFGIYLGLNHTDLAGGRETGIGLSKDTEKIAQFFIKNELKGPIFNDPDIGSYLIWYLYPKEKVYSDNRFGDAYSNEFFQKDYVDVVTNEDGWKETLEKYKFNTIIAYQYDNGYSLRDFIARRIRDPEWVWVYGDRFGVILVRNAPENQAVIDRYAITFDNMQSRFSDLLKTTNGDDQVAAADLFALGGEPNWARSSYAVAVAQNPKWAKVWWAMGEMEMLRAVSDGDPGLGAMFIETAIRYGWKTPNSYSYLALAYYRMGYLDKAEKAVQAELRLNPKSEDAKSWIGILAKARFERKSQQ